MEEGKPAFDYAGYFRRIREVEHLAVAADEISWQEKYQPPERPVDVLLYLGCNVLMTGHLAREVVAVFQKMGVDFQAIGGPQFCCGIVHHGQGDLGPATRLSRATVDKMESFGAKTLVMWCPSCDMHFDEVVVPTVAQDFGPEITHATQFLVDHLDELRFGTPVPTRVAVHVHGGTERQDRDAAAALTLLGAVPGVEVVGTVASSRLGYHCAAPPNDAARQAFRTDRNRLMAEARELGADTVVTLYHSCHREWCEAQSDDLAVRNYISIVAQSLGCGVEDRYVTLRKAHDPEEVVAASREQWTSHGWDAERANRVVGEPFPIGASKHQTDNG